MEFLHKDLSLYLQRKAVNCQVSVANGYWDVCLLIIIRWMNKFGSKMTAYIDNLIVFAPCHTEWTTITERQIDWIISIIHASNIPTRSRMKVSTLLHTVISHRLTHNDHVSHQSSMSVLSSSPSLQVQLPATSLWARLRDPHVVINCLFPYLDDVSFYRSTRINRQSYDDWHQRICGETDIII